MPGVAFASAGDATVLASMMSSRLGEPARPAACRWVGGASAYLAAAAGKVVAGAPAASDVYRVEACCEAEAAIASSPALRRCPASAIETAAARPKFCELPSIRGVVEFAGAEAKEMFGAAGVSATTTPDAAGSAAGRWVDDGASTE